MAHEGRGKRPESQLRINSIRSSQRLEFTLSIDPILPFFVNAVLTTFPTSLSAMHVQNFQEIRSYVMGFGKNKGRIEERT